jgi:hypothetical protein
MPGPSHRSARARGGPSERRAGAHRPRRTRQATERRHAARRVSWSRRIGLAGALLLLVGGSIAFASGALNSPGSGASTDASNPPLPAPQILAPAQSLTREPTIDLTLLRPAGLAPGSEYVVRITVNDETARELPLPQQEQFVISDIALTEGENSIRAALVDGGSAVATTALLMITRDSTAPVIRVTRPEPGSTVYSDTDTLRGRTEAGATLSLTNVVSGESFDATVDPNGRFAADLTLALGENQLLLSSRDLAGNLASAHITITRADSLAALTLTISDDQLKAANLPQRLVANAYVQDERGQPAEGAQVIFSLSPPNATTMTYRTITVGGNAAWAELDIDSPDDPHGAWLVTVLAILPSGTELRANKSLTVR